MPENQKKKDKQKSQKINNNCSNNYTNNNNNKNMFRNAKGKRGEHRQTAAASSSSSSSLSALSETGAPPNGWQSVMLRSPNRFNRFATAPAAEKEPSSWNVVVVHSSPIAESVYAATCMCDFVCVCASVCVRVEMRPC